MGPQHFSTWEKNDYEKGISKKSESKHYYLILFKNFQHKTWVALVTVVKYMKSFEREISNPQ